MAKDYAGLKRTQREEVLRILSDLEWHPYLDLNAVGGVRYSARLLELKRLGYKIEHRTVKGDTGRDYRLKSLTPDVPQAKMVKVFLTEAETLLLLRATAAIDIVKEARPVRASLEGALRSFRANRHKL